MSITNFIKDFSENFEETNESLFLPETKFRELDEWDSLTGLAVLNMLKVKYNKLITAEEFLKISTIEELFNCTI
jgi:acyl carrier protein